MGRRADRLLGTVFWLTFVVAGVWLFRSPEDAQAPQSSLINYFTARTRTIPAIDPSGRLAVYDPIFFQEADGQWSQVGYVQTGANSSDNSIRLVWHRSDLAPDDHEFILYRNSGRLEEVVATMLPPEKRLQIQQRLAATMSAHGDELSKAFVPLVQASLRQSLPVIEEEFRASIQRHRKEIDQLAGRWNDEVIEERLIPLARREILPIVREHGEPTANDIGRELWDRASIWRFGWRAIYDKSPLPRKDLVQEEWDRFVDEEAVPVFESHMDEVVTTVQKIVVDVAANSAVRGELGAVAGELANDPAARELVRQLLKETLVDNDRLHEVWGSVWSSQDARAALELAGDRLEPVVRQIGDDLFGTREEGITPGFARVLRNQILGKDRQWLVARRSESQSSKPRVIEIKRASTSMPYPIVHTASGQGVSP